MSKTKTLFTMALLVLVGSLGAAQAQSRLYEVNLYTTPAAGARAGGEDEMSGGVWLGVSPAPSAPIMVTLDYSVPLAGDIGPNLMVNAQLGGPWPQNKRRYNGGRDGGERG